MIYSVRWQLLLSMVAVIMLTVGMTALLANQAAIAEIQRAHEQVEAVRDQRLTTLVTRAYLQNRRWEDSRNIHKLSAAAAASSVRTALFSLDLLGVLQEYACVGLGCEALSRRRFRRFATTAYE